MGICLQHFTIGIKRSAKQNKEASKIKIQILFETRDIEITLEHRGRHDALQKSKLNRPSVEITPIVFSQPDIAAVKE